MAMRTQIDRKVTHRRSESDDAPVDFAKAESAASSQKLVGEMDEILDEIDSIIEKNAEEFVAQYVQKGGE
jgi:prokaryotic ubiquitin-like protein Pup